MTSRSLPLGLLPPARRRSKGSYETWVWEGPEYAARPPVELVARYPGVSFEVCDPKTEKFGVRFPKNLLWAWGALVAPSLLPAPSPSPSPSPQTQPQVEPLPPWPSPRPPIHIQDEARRFVASRKGSYLCLPVGSGKAQPDDAWVLTPEGYAPLASLVIGDVVVDPDGGFAKVMGVFPQGEQDVYRVEFQDGTATECTLDHLWLTESVDDRVRRIPGHVRPLARFYNSLWVAKDSIRQRKQFLPVLGPALLTSRGELPIHPYVLGVLLGDGSLSEPVSFTNLDYGVVSATAARLPDSCTLTVQGHRAGLCPSFRIVRKVRHKGKTNVLIDALRTLGLFGKRSWEKAIPTAYLFASIDDRRALLAGLMDTDGELCRRGAAYSSVSKALAEGVADLVRGLGGVVTVTIKEKSTYNYKGRRKAGRPSYQVYIRSKENPFGFSKRAKKWKPSLVNRGFEAVTYVGRKQVRCISVSSKRGLYFTNDFIPTHNTSVIATAAFPHTPVLICTLKSLAPNWQRELIQLGFLQDEKDPRWTELKSRPNLKNGTPDFRKLGYRAEAEWIFCHPEIMEAWTSILMGRVKFVILDEAHLFKGKNTLRTKAAQLASATTQSVGGHVCAASGTPLLKNPRELWPVLQALEPGAWGKEWDFRARYMSPELTSYGWKDGEPSNVDELKARLEYTMYARTREDIGLRLPPLTHNLVASDASARLRKASKTVLGADPEIVVSMLLSGRNLSHSTLLYITKLRQLASAEKVPTTVELATSVVLQGDAPIIFASFHATVEAIAAGLTDSFYVHGGLSATARKDTIEAWRAAAQTGTPKPLVATYEVLGVGQNLQEASVIVHHDLDWKPATHVQATGRGWRQGQTKPVTAYYVYARGTLDEVLARALTTKISHIAMVDGQALLDEYQTFAGLIKGDDVGRWIELMDFDQ